MVYCLEPWFYDLYITWLPWTLCFLITTTQWGYYGDQEKLGGSSRLQVTQQGGQAA